MNANGIRLFQQKHIIERFITCELLVGLRQALEGFVVTMHEGACETGSQIPTA